MTEKFVGINGFDNYVVSNIGTVVSYARLVPAERIWQWNPTIGYYFIRLYKNGRGKNFTIHSLVARAFLGECPEGYEVRHLDGNSKNNSIQNLKYGTRSENRQDSVKHGTHYSHGRFVTHCPRGHEYDEENTHVYNGKRICRTCKRTEALKRYYANKLSKGNGADESGNSMDYRG